MLYGGHADVVPVPVSSSEQPSQADDFSSCLEAARVSEHWALSALWIRYQPALLRYLAVVAPGHADDLASECWISAMSAISNFEGEEPAFRSWLFTIARRRAIDYSRKASSRFEILELEESIEHSIKNSNKNQVAPHGVEASVMEILGLQEAMKLLRTLPIAQADVIALRTIAGLSTEQVAAVLGKQQVAVRVLSHRGMRTLAKKLEILSGEVRAKGTKTGSQGIETRSGMST